MLHRTQPGSLSTLLPAGSLTSWPPGEEDGLKVDGDTI